MPHPAGRFETLPEYPLALIPQKKRELIARGVVGGRAVAFVLGSDGRFAPDGGGAAQSDAALRALAGVDGQQITYTCLPPGWSH